MRFIVFAGIIALIAFTPAPAPALDSPYAPATRDLSNPRDALKLMRDQGATGLSVEALAYYQEGIANARRGNRAEAIENLTNAAMLDPAFPEPHLALARIHFPIEPKAMFDDLYQAGRATVGSFDAQHLLLVNVVFSFLIVVCVGSLLTALYAVVRILPRIHHSLSEILRRWLPPVAASLLSVLILLAPALWRVGLVPVLLLFGGIAWWWMQTGDRRWLVTLGALTVAAPLVLWGFSPVLYSPLDPGGVPHLMGQAMSAPYSPGLAESLKQAREDRPDSPDLAFAEAMVLKRGGYYEAAEKAYEDALRFGASEALVYNNLGVIAFLRGDCDRALQLFDESTGAESGHAAPYYNMSLAYAKKLLFEKADEAMLEANRLSLNRIRAVLRNTADGEENPLLDETLPPSAMWASAWGEPKRMPGLPRWMSLAFPGSLGALPLLALPLLGLGIFVGNRLYRAMPSFACTNCGRPVCRRCLRRIRRAAYCTPCGDALLRIQSTAYTKLVLDSRLRRNRRAASVLPHAATWLLPGYHASKTGHTDFAAVLAMGAALGAAGLVNDQLPVTRLAWVERGPSLWWPLLPLLLLAAVYAVSVMTLFKLKPDVPAPAAEEDETLPGRPAPMDQGRAA